MQLHHDREAFEKRGAVVAVIANQDADELETFRKNAGLRFPVLVDEGAEVIARYGFTNEDRPSLPHPATLVLDEDGVVIFRRVNENYKERPEVGELLRAIQNR